MAKVRMYKTHTCQICKREGEYLSEKGVSFDEIFVDEDAAKAEEMIKLSGQMGTPVTVVTKDDGEEVVIPGFGQKQKEELNTLLGTEG